MSKHTLVENILRGFRQKSFLVRKIVRWMPCSCTRRPTNFVISRDRGKVGLGRRQVIVAIGHHQFIPSTQEYADAAAFVRKECRRYGIKHLYDRVSGWPLSDAGESTRLARGYSVGSIHTTAMAASVVWPAHEFCPRRSCFAPGSRSPYYLGENRGTRRGVSARDEPSMFWVSSVQMALCGSPWSTQAPLAASAFNSG